MPDEDLRTMVREFRASVATDLEAQHRRIDDLNDEMWRRFVTMETVIVNEIRDLGHRLDGIDGRLESIAGRLSPG